MITEIEQMTDKIMEDEVGKPILIPVDMVGDTVVKSLGHLSQDDQLEFLEKMKHESFRVKVDLAIRAHFDYLEEKRVAKLTKFMLYPKTSVEDMTSALEDNSG